MAISKKANDPGNNCPHLMFGLIVEKGLLQKKGFITSKQ